MLENQCTEWKESWRDEYLKVICAFANTDGGQLDIGRNDNGEVVDLKSATQLLEDIPNKLRNILGLTAKIELLSEGEKAFIRVSVDPYPNPISYKNQYYIRSGSTTSALTGNDLNAFILRKFGQTWEDVIVPDIKVRDLSPIAFSLFRKKAKSKKRIDASALDIDNWDLLNKLNLTKGEYITRAGVLLFHEEPERYITNALVKIGFFESDYDLRYHDVITGNLFLQLDRTLELLFSKYTKAFIRYEGAQRIEEMPFPQQAMREIVTNAIVHRDYSIPSTTQIRVYEDTFIVFSDGDLPAGITVDNLNKEHKSILRNPNIANAFFLAGNIESWGRGTNKVFNECKAYGIPEPIYKSQGKVVEVHLQGLVKQSISYSEKSSVKGSEKSSEKIIELMKANSKITISEMSEVLDITTRAVEKQIASLKKEKKIKREGSARSGSWKVLK